MKPIATIPPVLEFWPGLAAWRCWSPARVSAPERPYDLTTFV
jgi:hypothetical protein